MTISIITITYNSLDTLKHTIRSVQNQSYSNIEHIIIDGASTDGTSEYLATLPNPVKWISEPDKGIYNALNKGIEMATGDYVGILHADDIYPSSKTLELIVESINKIRCDLIYGDLEYVAKDNIDKVIRYWQSSDFHLSKLKKGWMPPHPTLYLKRSIYNKVGLFNEEFKIAADYDFMLRALSIPNISTAYIPQVLIKMRVGGASNRSLINILLKMKEDYRAIKTNHIGGVGTLFHKNFSKLNQFIKRDQL